MYSNNKKGQEILIMKVQKIYSTVHHIILIHKGRRRKQNNHSKKGEKGIPPQRNLQNAVG